MGPKRIYRNGGIFLPWDSFKVCWVGHFYTTHIGAQDGQINRIQIIRKGNSLTSYWSKIRGQIKHFSISNVVNVTWNWNFQQWVALAMEV